MITEHLMRLGSWSLQLREGTPKSIRDAMDWNVTDVAGFGHVFVFASRVDAAALTESDIMPVARYAGVLYESPKNSLTIGGYGMVSWLGDDEGKGNIFVTPLPS